MPDANRRHFGGLFDTFAELNRMREHWQQVETSAEARTQANAWVPILDIYAHDDDLVIRCELAGVEKDHVRISLSSGMLWISGERAGEPGIESADYYVRERLYGPFRRGIHLPQTVRPAQIRAIFADGLLEITIEGAVASRHEEAIEISSLDRAEVRLDVKPGET
jgi:HSP20 family protein